MGKSKITVKAKEESYQDMEKDRRRIESIFDEVDKSIFWNKELIMQVYHCVEILIRAK